MIGDLLGFLTLLAGPVLLVATKIRDVRRRPYDWRQARECEWLWDDEPPRHVKVLR